MTVEAEDESSRLIERVNKQSSQLTEEERLKKPSFWQRVAPLKGK